VRENRAIVNGRCQVGKVAQETVPRSKKMKKGKVEGRGGGRFLGVASKPKNGGCCRKKARTEGAILQKKGAKS